MSNQELFERLSEKIDKIASNQKDDSAKIDNLIKNQCFLENNLKLARDDAKEAKEEVQSLKNCIDNLTSENGQLKKHVSELEGYSKKYNLIFTGVRRYPNETMNQLRDEMVEVFNYMGLDFNKYFIDNMHRLPGGAVIVKFASFLDRDYIWSYRRFLAGSNPQVFMREHFSKEVELKRKTLFPIMKAAINNKMKAVLNGEKLFINSTLYTTDTLHRLPECLQPDKIGIREEQDYLFFYSGACFLSNFAPAKFKTNGQIFSCSEQYIQKQKCSLGEAPEKAKQVMDTSDPARMKAVANHRNLPKLSRNRWEGECGDIGLEAVMLKFGQNPELRDMLLRTGDKQLIEAAPRDPLWGIGLSIQDPDIIAKKISLR